MKTGIRHSKTIVLSLLLVVASSLVYGRNPLNPVGSAAQIDLLQQEIQRFYEIEKKGGWQKISLAKKQYTKGESAPAIRQLKKRLQASGDYTTKDTSSLYTSELESAVKKVQRRFGFPENGIVEASLVLALNVPAAKRRQQLEINLQRLQTGMGVTGDKHIVVNIPEYKLHVYEGGTHLFDMAVVVGKEKSPTEVFSEELTHVVFSPYWNVPPSIVKSEILPAMRKRKNYLAANGYEITGRENGLPVIRQKPGKNNSLGLVKFLFPNQHAIYFHDTPVKSLFKNRIRAYSHGCVRLSEPTKLAEYLLQNEASWTPSRIQNAMQAGKEHWVKLTTPVPVSIVYYTAWVDHEGELNFRDDIYNKDGAGAVAKR
ncbi:MAG TPA: L,D-transpeptidase family protein [Flavisolibacter sp.]|jgi:murein L,D-transpeptidase YcbB/YkuD|nr:L,D-transpeptidase family protein [Flavisolibacter sp.]